MSFWILTVLIIFNLVISNVIEIYDSVECEVEIKFEKQKYVNELVKMDEAELYRLISYTQNRESVIPYSAT